MNHASRLSPTTNVTFLGGEAELVAGLKANNPAAQRAFFTRYCRYVERVLRGVLGPGADLSDVTQDTFLAAFRQVGGLRAAVALTEWLRTIAVGVAHNRIRSRTRNRWLLFFAPQLVPEPAPLAPAHLEASQALREVYAVLGQMPAAERIAFSLRHIEDMTVPEIAKTTGVSESTAKRKLRHAEDLFEEAKQSHPALLDWCRTEGS